MKTMDEIYERLLVPPETPKGYRAGLQARFGTAVSHGEPYSQFLPMLQSSFSSALSQHLDTLRPRVTGLFQSLLSDFNDVYVGSEYDITDPVKLAFREEVLQYVVNAKSQLDGPIARDFAESALPISTGPSVRVKRERSN